MPERTILVTGATGAIGPSVVTVCHDAGFRVRTLSIDPCERAILPADTETLVGNVCDVQAVDRAVEGTDTVVHLAAVLHRVGTEAGLNEDYRRVNVGGTENVVTAAVAHGVRRIVFLSTIAVYGSSGVDTIDEMTTPRPTTEYGRSKLEAEAVVRSARVDGQPIGTILRSAAVYGPRVKGNYLRLATAIARRRFVPMGPGRNRRTLAYDQDLARAVLLAATHPASAGSVYNVTDGEVHTLATIIRAIYRALGRRPPRLRVPLGAVRAVLGVYGKTCRLAGVEPIVTEATLEKYTEDVAVSGSLVQRELGFQPIFDLDTGWKETMASLCSQRTRT